MVLPELEEIDAISQIQPPLVEGAIIGALIGLAPPEVVPSLEAEAFKDVEPLTDDDLRVRARSTWTSLHHLFTDLGLCADRLEYTNGEIVVSAQTKPTNIGLGLLSILCAEKLGFIDKEAAEVHLRKMLIVIGSLERNNGFFLDWYDSTNGKPLAIWPGNGKELTKFLSSADNAWMAMSLFIVSKAKPELSSLVSSLLEPMDFSFFFDNETQSLWGGYLPEENQQSSWHYSREFLSESRLIHYVMAAMTKSDIDRNIILKRLRNSDGELPSTSFGGSLFELLAPSLLVDEPELLEVLLAEIERHIEESHPDGWWGISTCDDPASGKYTEMGVGGFYQKLPVVAFYALMLALKFVPEEVKKILARLEKTFKIDTTLGHPDSIYVVKGLMANTQLLPDQVMYLLAITNHLEGNYFPRLMSEATEPAIITS